MTINTQHDRRFNNPFQPEDPWPGPNSPRRRTQIWYRCRKLASDTTTSGHDTPAPNSAFARGSA